MGRLRALINTRCLVAADRVNTGNYREGPFVSIFVSACMTMRPADLLSQLLSTNASPTSREAAFFRERMDHVEHEIEEIEGQACALERIGAMEDQANKLRSQIPALKNCLEQYKTILSPCRRVPLEILGEAFTHLADEHGCEETFPQTLARVCRVCKHWQDAAFLVPKLWSQVTVSVAARGFSYASLNTWLSRSHDVPRSLCLYSYPGWGLLGCRGGRLCRLSNPDIAKLLKQGPSLDAFTIACQELECFESFVALLQGVEGEGPSNSWSSLRSLTILVDHWDRWIPFDRSTFIPPSVTSLSLRLPSKVPVGWGHEVGLQPEVLGRLTTLELTCDWSLDAIFKLLQHSLALKCLTATFAYTDSDWSNSSLASALLTAGGLVLPNIRKCALHELTSNGCLGGANVLSCLKLPALVEFEISFGKDDRDSWCPLRDRGDHLVDSIIVGRLAAFLQGSQSTLQQVTIARVHFSNGGLFTVLKNLYAITELTLCGVSFDAVFFEKISPQVYFPKLHNLNIDGHVATSEEQRELVRDFVKSRGIEGHFRGCQVCGKLGFIIFQLSSIN